MGEREPGGLWTVNRLTDVFARFAFWVRRIAAPILRQTPEDTVASSEWALAFHIRHFGEDSGPACRAREDLARALDSAGRYTESRVMRELAVDAYRRHRGPEDGLTLNSEFWLMVSLAREGLYEGALPLAVHIRDGWRDKGVPTSEMAVIDDWVRFIVQAQGSTDK